MVLLSLSSDGTLVTTTFILYPTISPLHPKAVPFLGYNTPGIYTVDGSQANETLPEQRFSPAGLWTLRLCPDS